MRAGRPKLELLFGAYRRQVLSLLLLRSDEGFYVREIGRLTGVPAGALHREFKELTNVGSDLKRLKALAKKYIEVARASDSRQDCMIGWFGLN